MWLLFLSSLVGRLSFQETHSADISLFLNETGLAESLQGSKHFARESRCGMFVFLMVHIIIAELEMGALFYVYRHTHRQQPTGLFFPPARNSFTMFAIPHRDQTGVVMSRNVETMPDSLKRDTGSWVGVAVGLRGDSLPPVFLFNLHCNIYLFKNIFLLCLAYSETPVLFQANVFIQFFFLFFPMRL